VAIAKSQGLKFVYVGNVPGNPAENTYCPACGKLLIRRSGYSIEANNIRGDKCPYCGAHVAGEWK
jgi:pyruvate formate lyase activating enzyme